MPSEGLKGLRFKVNFRAPENLLIFGKSGDSGRPNNDGVVGHRDPLVEREIRGWDYVTKQ